MLASSIVSFLFHPNDSQFTTLKRNYITSLIVSKAWNPSWTAAQGSMCPKVQAPDWKVQASGSSNSASVKLQQIIHPAKPYQCLDKPLFPLKSPEMKQYWILLHRLGNAVIFWHVQLSSLSLALTLPGVMVVFLGSPSYRLVIPLTQRHTSFYSSLQF